MTPEPRYIAPAPNEDRWQDHARCKGLPAELFFPEQGGDTATAKAVCEQCPVSDPCREAGMLESFGVWAGLSEKQRRTLRKGLTRTVRCEECRSPFEVPLRDRGKRLYCGEVCKIIVRRRRQQTRYRDEEGAA